MPDRSLTRRGLLLGGAGVFATRPFPAFAKKPKDPKDPDDGDTWGSTIGDPPDKDKKPAGGAGDRSKGGGKGRKDQSGSKTK